MIANQTTVHPLIHSSTRYTLHFSAGLPTFARRVTSVLAKFANIPLLPYASLWEASVVSSLVKAAERFDADSRPTHDGFAWRV